MDYDMPVMNGLQAVKTLLEYWKETDSTPIPIAMVTAFGNEKEECLQAGVKYFSK